MLLLACALVLALGAAQAQAAPKGVVGFFGSSGAGAGQFSTPAGMAVNQSNGDLYVIDSVNNRVQQFGPARNFVRAWGWDVDGTLGSGTGFEVCDPLDPCKTGLSGAGAGQFSAAQGIAVDQATGDVYVTNQGNRRVDKFDSSGNFLFAFGWNVDPAGGSGQLETCTTTCQQGASGSGAGQFGASMGNPAVDPRNGDVVVADRTNRRVQKFDSSGAFLVAFGTAGSGIGQFASTQPVRVAVDSTGSIYTVESTTTRRVQKFNSSGTSAGIFGPAHASGTSNPTAPTDVAIDPSNDHVVVAKNTAPEVPVLLELDIAGGLADTHAAGAGLPVPNGLAVDGSNQWIYVSTTPDQRIYVLGLVTPPSATSTPATDVTATSATFHGTVNPNGGALPTGYRFEYSDDGGANWTRVPATDVDVGNGTAPIDVSQPATGLEPNTEYRVRLVASRPFAGGSDISDEQTFATDAAPPSVSGVAAREITDTTALLVGQVDPNRLHTTYRFEYGTDTSYGNSTAVDNAGSGPADVPVSKMLAGLQRNTTYHFRLVASNAAGESPGVDQTFSTAASPPQPSGRAYEMVSPLDKNSGHIDRDFLGVLRSQTGAAPSGDAVAFVSRVTFGDLESGTLFPNYLARREATGWSTEGISPPISNLPTGTDFPWIFGLSRDLSKAYVRTGVLLTPDASRLNGSWGLYMRSIGQPDRYKLLSSPSPTLDPPLSQDSVSAGQRRFTFIADTPDARHVVFNGFRRLLPESPPDATNSPNAVYEWVDGSLRLASVLPDGLTSTEARAGRFGGGGDGLSSVLSGDKVISEDGGRVFFTARLTSGSLQLFVREDGMNTVAVSASERPGDPPFGGNANADFYAAKSTDGSVAFFKAEAPLTEGAGTNSLYRWDANAPEGQRLTELSQDPLDQPGVQGPAATTDDARSVYFVATGELAAGATRGAPNLYLWREGEGARHIATLDLQPGQSTSESADGMMWELTFNQGGRAARVSADGERLLFASYAGLDPDYDTTEASAEACGDPTVAGERCRQIYLYDARSDELSCVTCVPGAPVTGDANLFGNSDERRPEITVNAPVRLPRNLTADGTRVFFETARQLVSADRNSVLDVYEWGDPDLDGQGELRLISPGRGTTDSKFLDATPSGDNVFFTTRERLVGIDTDDQIDLYDARVGGGIPAQHPQPVSRCQGDECQGALSGVPFLPGVGSGGASHGDLRPRPRPSFSVARLSRAQLAQLARGRAVGVRVRVNRAGRVRLSARAKVGKRMQTVAGASKRARKAGTVRLSVKLSRSARRELARERRLNVRLAVTFAGVREARTSMLRLRRARPSGERSAR